MKSHFKLFSIFAFVAALFLTGCNINADDGDIIKIYGATAHGSNGWYFANVSLNDFSNKTVDIDFSAQMMVINKGEEANLVWNVTGTDDDGKATYPVINETAFPKGTSDWVEIKESKKDIRLNQYPSFYLSPYELKSENFIFYIKDFNLTVTAGSKTETYTTLTSKDGLKMVSEKAIDPNEDPLKNVGKNWLKVTSLKSVFVDGGYFDRIGFACETNEITNANTATGLVYHGNTTTPGNELKPDFIFAWPNPTNFKLVDFTASNGKTIKVPSSINFDARMIPYLSAAKAAGIQMRGHVLTWHSQTPDFFFTKDYANTVTTDSTGKPSNLVDKETMTARQEWYIKSVLNKVDEWEAANGYGPGNHLIYSWDVVNEAVADDAADSNTGYLRGSSNNTKNKVPANGGSRWYQVYGSEEFIVNAFRFANAYAPADVTLCYNDYNEYQNYGSGWKTKGIIRLIRAVKNGEAQTINGKSVKPRIDAMGMQSHVGETYPTLSGYESAITAFLAEGIDIQITEFDINTTISDPKNLWNDYFKLFVKYSAKGSAKSKYNGHHITGVTIWGINDENSWINKDGTKHPLLFNKSGNSYTAKESFDSVIKTAK